MPRIIVRGQKAPPTKCRLAALRLKKVVTAADMTKIKAFAGIIYNQEKIEDISKVTCPPYDVISPSEQKLYHDSHPNNFIHILLGMDVPGEDKYERSAAYFRSWLKEKVFIQDTVPAIYFYSQEYLIKGEKKARLGFIALLSLDDKDPAIYGHEHTHSAPKVDRLKLLRKVKANLSPIFVVFQDKERIIQRTWLKIQGRPPFIELTDNDHVTHRTWRLDEPDVLKWMQAGLSTQNFFIADGHHRYEVARAYRQEKIKRSASSNPDAPFNYVMAYFTNTDQRGLSIFPIHRLLRLKSKLDLNTFLLKLKDYFEVEEVKDRARFYFLMEKGGLNEHLLGMYKNKRYWLLRLKNIKTLDKLMPDRPKPYRLLDVAILNTIIFKNIMGMEHPEQSPDLSFNPNPEIFISAVDKDPDKIAFFLNPVKIEQIISVALSGEKMPPKSTYFYPKVLSGLLINRIDS